MSDDPTTRIISTIERLRDDMSTWLDRLEAASQRTSSRPLAEVVAHVQGIGDAEGRLGDWVGERRSGRWIEGLTIIPPTILPNEFAYRVVLGANQISPWVPAGKFCGSMGLAMPLRGFCIALNGSAAAAYECSYEATFVGGSMLGAVPAGQICAMPTTFLPLEAFRVILRPRRAL